MICLGIDPGEREMGWGLIRAGRQSRSYLASGTVPATREAMVKLRVLLEQEAAAPLDLIAIERPDGFVFEPFRGPGLLRTAWAGGGVAWWAEGAGFATIAITPEDWKKALNGASRASDEQTLAALRVMLPGLPAVSNGHARDALGLAVIAVGMHMGGHKPVLREWRKPRAATKRAARKVG